MIKYFHFIINTYSMSETTASFSPLTWLMNFLNPQADTITNAGGTNIASSMETDLANAGGTNIA